MDEFRKDLRVNRVDKTLDLFRHSIILREVICRQVKSKSSNAIVPRFLWKIDDRIENPWPGWQNYQSEIGIVTYCKADWVDQDEQELKERVRGSLPHSNQHNISQSDLSRVIYFVIVLRVWMTQFRKEFMYVFLLYSEDNKYEASGNPDLSRGEDYCIIRIRFYPIPTDELLLKFFIY